MVDSGWRGKREFVVHCTYCVRTVACQIRCLFIYSAVSTLDAVTARCQINISERLLVLNPRRWAKATKNRRGISSLHHNLRVSETFGCRQFLCHF